MNERKLNIVEIVISRIMFEIFRSPIFILEWNNNLDIAGDI